MPDREQGRYWKTLHRRPRLVTDNFEFTFDWRNVRWIANNTVVAHQLPGRDHYELQHIAKQADEIVISGTFIDNEDTGERDSYSQMEDFRRELRRIPENPLRFTMPFGPENIPVYVRSLTFGHSTNAFGATDFNLTLVVVSEEEDSPVRTLGGRGLQQQTEFKESTLPPFETTQSLAPPSNASLNLGELPDLPGPREFV